VLKACEQQGSNAMSIKFEEAWLYSDRIVERLSAATLSILNE
jgi:hypothetical protein